MTLLSLYFSSLILGYFMKSTKLGLFLITFVLAGVGFFILPLVAPTLGDCPAVFALGILIGGVTISLLSPAATATGATISVAAEERQTLYVGNLPYRANEAIVRELFEKYGVVSSVRLVKDKQTGRRRGFGFVTMDEHGASKAMAALNDNEFQERILKVREAKEKTNQDNSSQASE